MSEEHFFYTNYTTQSTLKPNSTSDQWKVLSGEPTEPRLQFTLGVLGGPQRDSAKQHAAATHDASTLLEHIEEQVGGGGGTERSSCLSHNHVSFKFFAGTTPVD